MIKKRLYTEKDFTKVKDLCDKHGIAFPERNKILFVAEDAEGNITGICGLKSEIFIEPLIAENPLTANDLGRMIEGVILSQGINVVRAEIPSENTRHIEQLEKEGYVIVGQSKIIMEKYYGR